MKDSTSFTFIGVDVALATLCIWSDGHAQDIKNTRSEIVRFLKRFEGPCIIGIETTSTYHLAIAEAAFALGFQVFLLNPRDCARYRQALFGRGKTDFVDAYYIARFVEKEHDDLRPFRPVPEQIQRLRNLLRRRETTVNASVQLRMTYAADAETRRMAQPVMDAFERLLAELDKHILAIASEFAQVKMLLTIPGIGPLNAAAAISALAIGEFKSADSYVAYIGLDPKPKDSGASVGRRKISKRGERLLRKYIYLAAMSAASNPAWKSYYQSQLAKGLQRIQAILALASKMARTVWSVYTHQNSFQPERISQPQLSQELQMA